MWSYLVYTTERSINSIKNFFWVIRAFFLFLYLLICSCVAFYNYSGNISLALVLAISLDLIVFLSIWILTNVIHKFRDKNYSKTKTALCILRIVRILVRLTGSVMLLVKSVMAIEAGIGSLSVNIIILIFSCGILFFILCKEFIYGIVKYLKFKATQHINNIKRLVAGEQLSNEEKGKIE